MENTNNKCPGCSCHCDRNNLQCGKGEAYFRGEDISAHEHNRKEGRHHGKHHGHRRPEFPEGSLADLMVKCGHRLFHGEDDAMFQPLTDVERSMLKELLHKVLNSQPADR